MAFERMCARFLNRRLSAVLRVVEVIQVHRPQAFARGLRHHHLVVPVTSRFGVRAPAPESVVKSLARRSGETVVPHGASAANALGLTQQVPIREVYLTSGRSRKLKLDKREVLIKHAPPWMLTLGTRPAGSAIRALAWLGPSHVNESLASLRRTIPGAEWKALTSARASLPSWMARAIGNADEGHPFKDG